MLKFALLAASIVFYAEAFFIKATSSFKDNDTIITFNGTVCEVQDNVLYIDGSNMGKMTEEQQKQLEEYVEGVQKYNEHLSWSIGQAVSRMMSSVAHFFDNLWPGNWGSSDDTSETITQPEKSSTHDPADVYNHFPDPPEFCFLQPRKPEELPQTGLPPQMPLDSEVAEVVPSSIPEERRSEVPIPKEHQSEVPISEEHQSKVLISQANQSEVPISEKHQSEVPISEEHQSEVLISEENQSEVPSVQHQPEEYRPLTHAEAPLPFDPQLQPQDDHIPQ